MPDLRQIRTLDGRMVGRQDSLFVAAPVGGMVRCAPYMDHFIYREHKIGSPAFMCTCGSFASVVTLEHGMMLVCHVHATTGHHTTGGSRWI